MNETIILVALIVVSFATTIFALSAVFVLRRREMNNKNAKYIEASIERLDATLDSALMEINKLGGLVKKEIDEKYQAMLFLYDMVENKKKEIEEIDPSDIDTTVLAQYLESHVAELAEIKADKVTESIPVIDEDVHALNMLLGKSPTITAEEPPVEKKEWKRPTFTNPKHELIWDMRQQGKVVAEIAKELKMGQGEVQLILDLAERAS